MAKSKIRARFYWRFDFDSLPDRVGVPVDLQGQGVLNVNDLQYCLNVLKNGRVIREVVRDGAVVYWRDQNKGWSKSRLAQATVPLSELDPVELLMRYPSMVDLSSRGQDLVRGVAAIRYHVLVDQMGINEVWLDDAGRVVRLRKESTVVGTGQQMPAEGPFFYLQEMVGYTVEFWDYDTDEEIAIPSFVP